MIGRVEDTRVVPSSRRLGSVPLRRFSAARLLPSALRRLRLTASEWTSVWIIALYCASLLSTMALHPHYSVRTEGLGNRKVMAGPGLTQVSLRVIQHVLATSSSNSNPNETNPIPVTSQLYNSILPFTAVPGPSATEFPACVMRNLPDTYGVCADSWKDFVDGKYPHVLNYAYLASRTALKNRDRTANLPLRTFTVSSWALTVIPPGRDREMYRQHSLSPVKDHWIPVYPTPAFAVNCRELDTMPPEVQDYCVVDQPNLMADLGLVNDMGLYLRAYYMPNMPMYVSVAGVETSGYNYATVVETMVRDTLTFEVEVDIQGCYARNSWDMCYLVVTRQSLKSVVLSVGAARLAIWTQCLGFVVLPFISMLIARLDVGFTSFFVSLRFGYFHALIAQMVYYLFYDVPTLCYYRPLWSALYYNASGHINGWLLLIQFVAEVFTVLAYILSMFHKHTSIPKGNVVVALLFLLAIAIALAVEAISWQAVDNKSQYQACINGKQCAKYGVTCCGDVPLSFFFTVLSVCVTLATATNLIVCWHWRNNYTLIEPCGCEKLNRFESECLSCIEQEYRRDRANCAMINGARTTTVNGLVNTGFMPVGGGLIRCEALLYLLPARMLPRPLMMRAHMTITYWEMEVQRGNQDGSKSPRDSRIIYAVVSTRRCHVTKLRLLPRFDWHNVHVA